MALIAGEMVQAREEAARAKAARDKGRQKACGQLISQLRQEMQALGITDAVLDSAAGTAGGDHPSGVAAAGAGAAEGEEEERQVGGGEWGLQLDAPPQPAAPAAGGKEQRDGSDAGSEPDMGLDLFGGDDGGLDALETSGAPAKDKAAARAAKAAAALQPWGAPAAAFGGKKGSGGGGKKGAGPKPPQVQQPKALLQKQCQQRGWAPPRFERLPQGGMRLEVRGWVGGSSCTLHSPC